MKTILVATDFSEASRSASLYAVNLAKRFNARLILFSSYQPVVIPVTETPVFLTPEDTIGSTRKLLEEYAAIINSGNSVNVETLCTEGPAADTILNMAKDKRADIIITGMKGTGKVFRKLFGSTVTALSRVTSIPLIVVPEQARYTNPESIALATEDDIEVDADKHLLDTLLEIAKKFHSRFYMVRVAKNKFHETFEVLNRPLRLNKIVSSLDPQYECLHGVNITQVLNDFVSEHNINMLALLPHKHSLFERLFIKSITRSMTFETHIPLLIIPHLQEA